jgi:enoyl-CoA hydratase/carnithine racemase
MSIDFHLEGAIATIVINRPERRNALDADHYQALSDAWVRVRDDEAIRAAIITGAGDKAFSAGADLKSWVGREQSLSDHWLTQKGQLLNRGLEVWKPVLAAVNGACVAGGMTLLLATDMRVASRDAVFSLAEVKRGIIAANGGTQRIMRQLPYAVAMEMLLLGDAIDAETALRWGLINRVVAPEDVMGVTQDLARRICENAPLAVQAAKELAIRGQDVDLATGLRMEQMVNRLLHQSEDTAIAKAAFAEKRKPEFKGK